MARRRVKATPVSDDAVPDHLRRFYPPPGARFDSFDSFTATYWPAVLAWRAERAAWFADRGLVTRAERDAAEFPRG